MSIRNEIDAIVELKSHICQDFLQMILCDNWQERLYNKAKSMIETSDSQKKNYVSAYNLMCEKGYTNYTVKDMDVSFIVVIVQFCSKCSIVHSIQRSTLSSLIALRDDRNIKCHSSDNEPIEVLFDNCHVSLRLLKTFIERVNENETFINDTTRLSYIKKYYDKIESLQKHIDKKYLSLVQWQIDVESDIQSIKSSDNQLATWTTINRKYLDLYHTIDQYKEKYYPFVIAASNAGIIYAHLLTANYYISINSNPSEAEYRMLQFYKAYKDLPQYEAKELVDCIHVYQLNNNSITPQIEQILEGIRSQGYSIGLTEDGIYYWPSQREKLGI